MMRHGGLHSKHQHVAILSMTKPFFFQIFNLFKLSSLQYLEQFKLLRFQFLLSVHTSNFQAFKLPVKNNIQTAFSYFQKFERSTFGNRHVSCKRDARAPGPLGRGGPSSKVNFLSSLLYSSEIEWKKYCTPCKKPSDLI